MQVRGGKAATDTVDARATRRYDLALAGRQTDTPALARRVMYSVTRREHVLPVGHRPLVGLHSVRAAFRRTASRPRRVAGTTC